MSNLNKVQKKVVEFRKKCSKKAGKAKTYDEDSKDTEMYWTVGVPIDLLEAQRQLAGYLLFHFLPFFFLFLFLK